MAEFDDNFNNYADGADPPNNFTDPSFFKGAVASWNGLYGKDNYVVVTTTGTVTNTTTTTEKGYVFGLGGEIDFNPAFWGLVTAQASVVWGGNDNNGFGSFPAASVIYTGTGTAAPIQWAFAQMNNDH